MLKTPLLICLNISLFVFFSFQVVSQPHLKQQLHNSSEIAGTELPTGFNELFAASGECLLCHNSMTNEQGEPIGILDDWRSTMMANAAKDPLWRAKVSHESLVNPEHAKALQDVCTRCHAPLGNFNAHHLGQEYYGIDDMVADPLAMDGVSCTSCHQIKNESLGIYSGNLLIGTAKQIWGPYIDPFTMPMFNNTGYTPNFGDQIKDSQLCGSCHSLITNSVDLNGNPTGDEFVEQAIYHEWINSIYPDQGTSCQTCHVPEIDDIVKISTMPPWLEGRSPFGMHHFVGANVFMQKIFKENIDELGITAEPQHFDSTITRTSRLLQESTLETSLNEVSQTSDTLFLVLSLKNLAGHKFPGGFPSRRTFVEIILLNENDDTIFHSGKMDGNYNLVSEDASYENHHDIIRSEEQVQIYEMVMGDVNSDVTTVLERASEHLKDNRLPPQGFKQSHNSYDTAEIAGLALADENFNKDNGNEGTGTDLLFINAPINDYVGTITVEARVWYQTVSVKWLQEMFTHSSEEIDLWEDIYNSADRQPVLITETILTSVATGTKESKMEMINIYPNPSKGIIYIDDMNHDVTDCIVYRLSGEKIMATNFTGAIKTIDLQGRKGTFLLVIKTRSDQHIVRKIIVN